jgi:hypothetical protein
MQHSEHVPGVTLLFRERAAARIHTKPGKKQDEIDHLFQAAHQFQGYWYGRVFKMGLQGVGYYTDSYSTEMSVAEWEQRCARAEQMPVPADSVQTSTEISPHVKLQADAFLQSLQASMENGVMLSESQLEFSQKATRTLARDAGVDATQLARYRKAAGDAFNAKEAMWTWPHELLVAQQVSARQGTRAGQAQRYPWVLPQVSTARWHVNETVAETLAFCASVPDVELYACPVTTHVPVLWFQKTQLQRAQAAGVTAPVAEGPQPFCKYWWTGRSYIEHFDVGSADVYHGFGNTGNCKHATDFAMPESMLDLLDDSLTWDYIHD